MVNKKFMILSIFLISLLAVSAVNAADNTTSDIVIVSDLDNYDVINYNVTCNPDILGSSESQDANLLYDDNNVLSEKSPKASDYGYGNGYGVSVDSANVDWGNNGNIQISLDPCYYEGYYNYDFYLKIYDSNGNQKVSERYVGTSPTNSLTYTVRATTLDSGKYTVKIVNNRDNVVMSTNTLTVTYSPKPDTPTPPTPSTPISYPSYKDYSVRVHDDINVYGYEGGISMEISNTNSYCFYLKVYDSSNNEVISQLFSSFHGCRGSRYTYDSELLRPGKYTIKIINYLDYEVMSTAILTVVRYPHYSDYSVNISDISMVYGSGGSINMSISPAIGFTAAYCYYLRIYDSADKQLFSKFYSSEDYDYSISYNIDSHRFGPGTYTIKIINYLDDMIMNTAKLTICCTYPSYQDYSVNVSDALIIYGERKGIIYLNISPASNSSHYYKSLFYVNIYDSNNKLLISDRSGGGSNYYQYCIDIDSTRLSPGNYTIKVINYLDNKVMSTARLIVNYTYPSYKDYSVNIQYPYVISYSGDYIHINIRPASYKHLKYCFYLKVYDSSNNEVISKLYCSTSSDNLLRSYKVERHQLNPGTYTAKIINYYDNRVMDTNNITVITYPTYSDYSVNISDISMVYGTGGSINMSISPALNFTYKYYFYLNVYDSKGDNVIFQRYSSNCSHYSTTYNISSTQLRPGNYTIKVINYLDNKVMATASLKVNKIRTTIIAPDVTTNYMDDNYIVATLKDYNGNIIKGKILSINLNDINYFITDSNGQVEIPTNHLAPKKYTVTITFDGDDYFERSSISAIVIVEKETFLTSVNLDTVYGSNNYLIAKLKDDQNNPLSGAQLNIILNGKTYTRTTDVNGKVKLSTAGLVPNNYIANIVFAGDNIYKSSNITAKIVVNKLDSRFLVLDFVTIHNSGENFVAILIDANGNGIIGAKVTVKLGDVTKTLTTNAKGQISLSTDGLAPNTYTATITFDGNDIYKKSSTSATVTIKQQQKQTKIFLRNALYFVTQTKMVQVTLWDGNNQPLAGKTVYIRAYDSVWHGVTDENGDAFVRVGIGFGTHDATVSFDGDDQYFGSEKAGYIRVIKQTPSVMVRGADTMFKASDNNKIVKVHLRDRYDKALPEGSKIVIKLNGKTYVGTTDINGVAHIKININTVGTFTAQAMYGGNTAFNEVKKDIKIRIV